MFESLTNAYFLLLFCEFLCFNQAFENYGVDFYITFYLLQ